MSLLLAINVFLNNKSLDDFASQANVVLNKLVVWFKLNKLSLRIKTRKFYFVLSNKIIRKKINLRIDDISLEEVTNLKYFGAIFN